MHRINWERLASAKRLKRYVYPVQLDDDELEALNTIAGNLGTSKSEAIRMAIKGYSERLRGLEVVKIRDLPRNQARKEIVEFLNKKERAWSSGIADALRLDLSLVNSILQELWSEKRVEPTT